MDARARRDLRRLRAEFSPYINEILKRITYLGSDDESDEEIETLPSIFEPGDVGFSNIITIDNDEFEDTDEEEEEEDSEEEEEPVYIEPNFLKIMTEESDNEDDAVQFKYSTRIVEYCYEVIEPDQNEFERSTKRRRGNGPSESTKVEINYIRSKQ
jgi:hypothetical protein